MSVRSWACGLMRPPLTGRHVLVYMIAFFAVIFAVNGVFLYVSLQTHPGVTSPDAYRRGLHFNLELDRAEQQNARGWKVEINILRGVPEIRLSDSTARPVAGLNVSVTARRPVHDRADATLVLREIEPGRYRSVQPPLAPGRWELVFIAAREGLAPYRIGKVVQVPR